MSNPAAVAVPVQDAGDGRWMSMVSKLKSTLSQPAHPISYIYMNLRLQLNSWPLQLSWLERCTGIAGP